MRTVIAFLFMAGIAVATFVYWPQLSPAVKKLVPARERTPKEVIDTLKARMPYAVHAKVIGDNGHGAFIFTLARYDEPPFHGGRICMLSFAFAMPWRQSHITNNPIVKFNMDQRAVVARFKDAKKEYRKAIDDYLIDPSFMFCWQNYFFYGDPTFLVEIQKALKGL